MRFYLGTCLALITAGYSTDLHAQLAGLPPPGAPGMGPGGPPGLLFISPMGEPFRGGGDPQNQWFDQADTNHDGALSRDESVKDAARWFMLLDRGHDGEIDPDDIEFYETVLAPEIRVGGPGGPGGPGGGMGGPPGGGHMGGGGMGGGGMGGGGMGGGGMGGGGMGGGGMGHGGPPGGGEGDGPPGGQSGGAMRFTEGKQGAARFSYFDYPEPITVADTNFNRGVDPREFIRAADNRFVMLDTNHDGLIQRKELPRISLKPMRGPGRGPGRGGPPGGMPIPDDRNPNYHDPADKGADRAPASQAQPAQSGNTSP